MRASRLLLVCTLVLTVLRPLAAPAQQPLAQDPPAPIVDLTPEQRRHYDQGLTEARSLIAEGQLGRATARLDALIAARPREAQARFLKGVVQSESGETEAAIATFRALIDDYPEIPEPYNNLAVLYGRRGEIEAARTALLTAIKTAPDWAVPYENLGDVYARLAVEQYERAQTLDRANKTAPAKLKLARDLLAAGATRP
ncbi:MAG: tetratricopeptide repeat protein [Casimicrobiaceae bacterium]